MDLQQILQFPHATAPAADGVIRYLQEAADGKGVRA